MPDANGDVRYINHRLCGWIISTHKVPNNGVSKNAFEAVEFIKVLIIDSECRLDAQSLLYGTLCKFNHNRPFSPQTPRVGGVIRINDWFLSGMRHCAPA